MSDPAVTIVSFFQPEQATALQGALSERDAGCDVLSCEQWLSDTAKSSQTALLFYFGRGLPGPSDVERMRQMAAGHKWRAVFEGPRPTKLPKALLLPPRYFLWPEDHDALVDWIDAPGQNVQEPRQLGLLGTSAQFARTTTALKTFARCDAPLLLSGATGTGKATAAHAAHKLSARADGPFITLHGTHFAQGFGHNSAGSPFADAVGGTLFLKDLDDLDQAGQIDLLNWLNAEQQLVTTGCAPRIIATARSDLRGETAHFRPDLYFRLAVLTLHMPALRDRADDVVELAEHFVTRFASQAGAPRKPMSRAFVKALRAYDWPGNVRELENFMQRAWVLSRGPEITIEQCNAPGMAGTCAMDGPVGSYHEAREATLRAFESVFLERLMRASGGNVTRAAEMAGTERRSLGRMLKRNNIQPSSGT